MYNLSKAQTAIAAIRVSSTRQGTDGDSPEAQREQINRYVEGKNIKIKKYFEFLESASKEIQPMQKAIDYCKNPKNKIDVFIIKSIDRFTRGGSYSYSSLKMQLEQRNARLIDIYGIIGAQKVNTLEHLNVSYGWSVYEPTKNSEILEAERASDEKRDIMSRMIGAEIRYTRLGYWMRQAPYGYIGKKIITPHGKRTILTPHPKEAKYVVKLFELRARGTLTDNEISEELNRLGFRSRVYPVRSKIDRSKIVGERGGNTMNAKRLQLMIAHPIYAGFNDEVWANGELVRCRFKGLVTPELFNLANKGKIIISPDRASITYALKNSMPHTPVKTKKTHDYPYRRVVLCPYCEHPFMGSASRGKTGKYYPAYHCNSSAGERHYFRVSKAEFENTIQSFVQSVRLSPDFSGQLSSLVVQEWDRRQESYYRDLEMKRTVYQDIRGQVGVIAKNLCFTNSRTAVRYLEDELEALETEARAIAADIEQAERNAPLNSDEIADMAKQRTGNLFDLLLGEGDAMAKQQMFGLLFDELPNYHDLQQNDGELIAKKLSELFLLN